jgi:adenylate cyclase class IV
MREVEIKALLTEEQYHQLQDVLRERYEKIEDDTITTHRFRPHDVRVRYSDKITELVYKSDDPTVHDRQEITINLKDLNDARSTLLMLEALGFKQDPPWVKRKEEFLVPFEGEKYTLSLQFIENFAFILEAEIMAEHAEQHIPRLKQILKDLGCEPIDPAEFKRRIQEYIARHS